MTIIKIKKLLLFISMFLLISISAHTKIIYVAPDGLSSNDGNSWNTPKDFISAFTSASTGDEIWLKKGDYFITLTSSATIETKGENVSIIGGFKGDENSSEINKNTFLKEKSNLIIMNNYSLILRPGYGNLYAYNISFNSEVPPSSGRVLFGNASVSVRFCNIYNTNNFLIAIGSGNIFRGNVVKNSTLTIGSATNWDTYTTTSTRTVDDIYNEIHNNIFFNSTINQSSIGTPYYYPALTLYSKFNQWKNNLFDPTLDHFIDNQSYQLKITSPYVDNGTDIYGTTKIFTSSTVTTYNFLYLSNSQKEAPGSLAIDLGVHGGTSNGISKNPHIKDIICKQDGKNTNTFFTYKNTTCYLDVNVFDNDIFANYSISFDNASVPFDPNTKTFPLTNLTVPQGNITAQVWFSPFPDNKSVFTKTIQVIEPTIDITFGGKTEYIAVNSDKTNISNTVTISSNDNDSIINSVWTIKKDNEVVFTGTSNSRTFTISKELLVGNYTIEVESTIANTQYKNTKTLNIIVNPYAPIIRDVNCYQNNIIDTRFYINTSATCKLDINTFDYDNITQYNIKYNNNIIPINPTTKEFILSSPVQVLSNIEVIAWFEPTKTTKFYKYISFIDPTPSINIMGDNTYYTNTIGKAQLNNTIYLSSSDNNAVIETQYLIKKDNVTIFTSPKITDKTILVSNTLDYGKYTLEISSKIQNTTFIKNQTFAININIPTPIIEDDAITCSKYETIIGDNITCSINTSKVSKVFGTLGIKWDFNGQNIANDISNISITLPNEIRLSEIKTTVFIKEQNTASASRSFFIRTINPVYRFQYLNWSEFFDKKDNVYPIDKNKSLTVRFLADFPNIKRKIKVFKNNVLLETIVFEPSTDSFEYKINANPQVYALDAYRFEAYTDEYPNVVSKDNIYTITAPAKLSTPVITSFEEKPVDTQTVKVEIKDNKGTVYDKDDMGELNIRLLGRIGTQEVSSPTYTYISNEQPLEIELIKDGYSILYAEITYKNDFFTQKYLSNEIKFYAYISKPIEMTLKNFTIAEAYLPYKTSLKADLVNSNDIVNLGTFYWQLSRDNVSWTTIDNSSDNYYLIKDLETSGDHYFRVVSHHKVKPTLKFESEPIYIKIRPAPETIDNLPIYSTRYNSTDFSISTKNEKGVDGLSNLSLVKDFKENIDYTNSYWKFYNPDTNELIGQVPFKNVYRTDFSRFKLNRIKVSAELKTNLNRTIWGEKILDTTFIDTLNGLNLTFKADGDKNIVLIYCDNNCITDEIKSNLVNNERILSYEWKVYKDNPEGQEIKIFNPSLKSVTIRNIENGNFYAILTYNTSYKRKIKGELQFYIDWKDYVDPKRLEPIEADVSLNYNSNRAPSVIKGQVILKDKNRLQDVGRIEWYVDEEKVSDNFILEYMIKDGGIHRIKSKIYNKFTDLPNDSYIKEVNLTEPLPKNYGSISASFIDETKIKLSIEADAISLEEKESIQKSIFTIKDVYNKTLKTITSYSPIVYLSINEIEDNRLYVYAEAITSANRLVEAYLPLNLNIPMQINGGDIQYTYNKQQNSLNLKCSTTDGCLDEISNMLFKNEKITNWNWNIYRNNELLKTSNEESPIINDLDNSDYQIQLTLTTTYNRNISTQKEISASSLKEMYSDNITFDPVKYFAPKIALIPLDLLNGKYNFTVSGINYNVLSKNYNVKLSFDNKFIDNPTKGTITLQGFGNKTFIFMLMQKDGTLIKTTSLNYTIKSIENIISDEISKINLSVKNIDPKTNTIRIGVVEFPDDLRNIITNPTITNSTKLTYGIQVRGTAITEQKFPLRDYAFVTLGSTTTGSLIAQYYIIFNNKIYTSPEKSVDVSNVLSNIELFDAVITRQIMSPYWGSYAFKIIPLAPSGTLKYLYWNSFIVRKGTNEILYNAENKSNFGYQFKQAGLYQLVINVYTDKEKKTVPYYSKKFDINVINEMPVVTKKDFKLSKSYNNDIVFTGKIYAVDPDSKIVKINWRLCDGKFKKDNYDFAVFNLGKDIDNCNNNYFELSDGIGITMRYDINLNELMGNIK